MPPGPMFASRPDPPPLEVSARLRGWVRAVLDLDEDEVVTVTQLACRDRDCAPVETVLSVLRPRDVLSRSLPLPAGEVRAVDVLTAFGPQQAAAHSATTGTRPTDPIRPTDPRSTL